LQESTQNNVAAVTFGWTKKLCHKDASLFGDLETDGNNECFRGNEDHGGTISCLVANQSKVSFSLFFWSK
jgi:hypothetical protein